MKNDFLQHVAARIGDNCVINVNYLPDNVSNFYKRKIKGIFRPNSLTALSQIVNEAKKYSGTRLHPISIGYNWGLGSKEDIADGSYLIELDNINAIRKINIEQGWAIVEPGVTQGQLSTLLKGTGKMINITASSAYSSFLGNALDRGVGLRHQRTEDLVGLEVILPNGKIIRVGWWPTEQHTAIYSHGVGPSLVQFFAQSSFGIVTAGVVKLHSRPELTNILRFNFSRSNLIPVITTLQHWVSNRVNSGVLKIYDSTANTTYGGIDSTYTVHMCIDGLEKDVYAKTQHILEYCEISDIFSNAVASQVNEDHYPGSDIIANLVEAAHVGDTSFNDVLLKKTLGAKHDMIDKTDNGWIFFLPLLPFTPDALLKAYEIIDEIHAESGILCGATINALNEGVIDLVISIAFNKKSEEQPRTLHALDLLHEKFQENGFIPYRLGVNHSEWASKITPSDSENDFIRELKSLIDPQNIISNDRYL
ncbi:FAD-binding oxidoreductase [Xenorhabdus kozodoii]|uniref:4-cresol dehydrogenase flavoprotein subunit n=1 Tax=Xenorhabdus kozodoii TaxID=351676 RepID=A0A2D0L2U8_9GAMM|nr:FAD-dependent oxidoreductase [Xenorhabdus kozodoii]PHM70009.1 4-cresol dehydrogenase flavoprotein subunit [Xenorhabdus kozodoii]